MLWRVHAVFVRADVASGKVLSAIHVCPEAVEGGPISKVRDGDLLRVDAEKGALEIVTEGVLDRAPAEADLSGNEHGQGRSLFASFRAPAITATAVAARL